MGHQTIQGPDGKPLYALVPIGEYEALLRAAEELEDVAAYEAAKDDETVPAELVYRLAEGENPVRLWRKHRGLRQGALARRAGILQSYLSDIESGKADGSLRVIAAIARALEVELDDLISSSA